MEVILTALASTGFFSLVQFLIKRHDERKGKTKQFADAIESLKKKIDRQERDSCRTQLLLLMSDFPDMKDEILKVAEHYFKDLEANWYMTTLFSVWCEKHNINLPMWAMRRQNDER